MTRAGKFGLWFGAAAACGIGVFLVLAWRAIDVVDASPTGAATVFSQIRREFAPTAPLLRRTAGGTLARATDAPEPTGAPVHTLYIVAFRRASGKLVRAEVPFWFFKLKAPAAQLMVRDTGFDLDDLGLTGTDLERQGPCLILDEEDAGGDRVAIWTQ